MFSSQSKKYIKKLKIRLENYKIKIKIFKNKKQLKMLKSK